MGNLIASFHPKREVEEKMEINSCDGCRLKEQDAT